MRRQVQIEILELTLILLLLSWVSPQQIAYAKEAPARPLNNRQNSLTDKSAKYLLAKRDRTSENSSETRAGTTSENESHSTSDSTADSTSDSQSGSSASDGYKASSGSRGEDHTLLYYAIQAIGILIGVTVLLALISSSSVIFLATVWHTLKLMNGGKKPSIG